MAAKAGTPIRGSSPSASASNAGISTPFLWRKRHDPGTDIRLHPRARRAIGWTPETSGPCCGLPIRDEISGDQPSMTSCWEPTPAELAAIASGGKIYLRVIGQGHPPVMVYALGPAEAEAVPA